MSLGIKNVRIQPDLARLLEYERRRNIHESFPLVHKSAIGHEVTAISTSLTQTEERGIGLGQVRAGIGEDGLQASSVLPTLAISFDPGTRFSRLASKQTSEETNGAMFRLLGIALLLAASPVTLPAQKGPALQENLEKVYEHWRQSMIRSDYRAWKQTTAYARQIETRNTVVSQKQPFPAAVFALPMKPPALKGLRPLHVRTKEPTATAVYFGQVDFNVDAAAPEHSLLVLRFLKEGHQWKFFRLSVMSQLHPEVIADVRANRLDFLEEPEFQPAGRPPAIQRPCPAPDYITDVHLISLGFETDVTINGISEHSTSDHFGTQLVIGGLKDGKNTIRIESQPLKNPPSGQKNLKVTVHVKTGNQKEPAVKVFEFKPDPAKGPFTYTGEIMADKSTLGRYAK